MLLNNKRCVDAGTTYCPCGLAEYDKCIVCSRLNVSGRCAAYGQQDGRCQVPATCDCQWQGTCIYNEYLQNNHCINDTEGSLESGCGERRQSRLCKIQKIKWFDDDLAVMQISVPRGMAEKAALPGPFIFVRAPGAECCFDFPVSVLRADYENATLEIAVKVLGPKSRALLDPYRENGLLIDDTYRKPLKTGDWGWVKLRGIYRNGLLGAEKLMDPAPKRVLCLTKGVGLAPATNYIRWAEGRDRIDIIADLDKINREFADYALRGALPSENTKDVPGYMKGIESVVYGPLPINLSWAESEKYDVIIISASDYYQQNIYVPAAKKVLSNNHTMCCGEGICGACMCVDADGSEHRTCKECKCTF